MRSKEGENAVGSPLTQLLRTESIRALSVSMDLTLISFALRASFLFAIQTGHRFSAPRYDDNMRIIYFISRDDNLYNSIDIDCAIGKVEMMIVSTMFH